MVINHNISALNTYNQLTKNEKATASSLQKLSSGLRINSAADDAAGLAISQKMQAQVNGLDQATRNAQDGISLVQTAEGALSETQSILQRMRTLAVQSANDTNTTVDRSAIQAEVTQLKSEIDRISTDTEFISKKLLNGDAATSSKSDPALGDIRAVGVTADTKTATVTVGSAGIAHATAATATADDLFTADKLTADRTFSINGTTLTFAANTSSADVIKGINNAGLGVVATTADSGKDLVVSTTSVGSAAKLSSNVAAASTIADDSGADATIALTDTYTAKGNTITITSGDLKGLQLDLTNSATGTGAIGTIEVTKNGGLNIQIGANAGQSTFVSIGDMSASSLGVNAVDLTTTKNASNAIDTIDAAIQKVSTQRSALGAYQNRLDHTINNLGVESQNLTSAAAAITDVDMAKEMMSYTKTNILNQAAQAMLAQANQLPQGVLQLLK